MGPRSGTDPIRCGRSRHESAAGDEHVIRPSIRLGRVAGIEVDAHWSVLVIMGLFAWSLADLTLPDLAPGSSSGAYWIAAVLAVVVLFSSLLAHEIAHSVVARRTGIT